uniref:Uncharacterized protein n=1 Tax=Janibacter limosus TaxID=53458 RepID=A0AC61U643_9MICO|nr:hypothetical protein [Janibacter limosus]
MREANPRDLPLGDALRVPGLHRTGREHGQPVLGSGHLAGGGGGSATAATPVVGGARRGTRHEGECS